MLCVGQNPATSLNGSAERAAMRKLDWLVVKDNWLTETAMQWKNAPEIEDGSVKVEDIKTEIFFFPATQVGEYEGSFTNTQRMLQWHFKAADPPGDCRTDTWFYYQLGKRLKRTYADSTLARDEGWKNLVWDYERDPAMGREPDATGEPDELKILREINGYHTGDPTKHLAGFGELKDDGSTTCASWIYCGVFPAWESNLAARREPDPPGVPGAHLNWAWAWPANRRLLYNRASADPSGQPWSERKRYVWWDEEAGRWTGLDTPDFEATKRPDYVPPEGAKAQDAIAGTDPFIMQGDGKAWLYAPAGLADGPMPTHYEPAESPVENAFYKQQSNPAMEQI